MLTKVSIQNFKKLEQVEFSLSQSVVLIGPNNAGKSTIFQALCLWEIGVTNFIQAYSNGTLEEDNHITVNRKDLLTSPIDDTRFLWRNKIAFKNTPESDLSVYENIPLLITLSGENNGVSWSCPIEFIWLNAESIDCRFWGNISQFANLYESGQGTHFGFLQPMSGLTTQEDLLTPGAIARRLGEGRTAEVLRNVCYQILHPETVMQMKSNVEANWTKLKQALQKMFGAELHEPEYSRITGLLQLSYSENGIRYDISSAGRGFQQTLLLLAYMYANPGTTLLLDEPDAHLEVIRQREAFQLINAVANETQSQLIIASHSEVVLDEAADASNIIAVIDSQAIELNPARHQKQIGYLKKALTEIGWERYYLARLKKHVLYLEGSTDLEMLKKFAEKINANALSFLEKANVQYTAHNVPGTAINSFLALKEFIPDLKGFALFDHVDKQMPAGPLAVQWWQKREFENYFARPDVLIRHAGLLTVKHPSFDSEQLKETMTEVVNRNTTVAALEDMSHEFWSDTKLSDKWLDIIFPEFYKRLSLPQNFYKRDYYQLISLLQPNEIDPEIAEKLNAIISTLQ